MEVSDGGGLRVDLAFGPAIDSPLWTCWPGETLVAAAPPGPDLAFAERQAGLLAAACELAQAGLDRTAVLEVVARAAANLVGDCGYIRLVSANGEFADLVAFFHRDPGLRRSMGKQFSQHRLKAGE